MKDSLIIGLDFDGTVVTHDYPNVGIDIGAVPVLKEIVAAGHRLMLWTMRGNKPTDNGKNTLQDAVDWFEENGIPLWGINENPEQTESGWSNSHKQYAQLYIDDAALGCPLIYPGSVAYRNSEGIFVNLTLSDRPYVDWSAVRRTLVEKGVILSVIGELYL